MWKAVLLRVLYYVFFIAIFLLALLIFLRLTDFYFGIGWLENFLDSFVSWIDF